MSTEGRSARSGGRGGTGSVVPQPYPAQFYPMVGYQGPPQPWFPAHSSSGAPTPWAWSPPMGYPAPTPAWSTQQTASTMTTSSSTAAAPSDEYTVDTLRRIYNDDDGRVEIQRVKVQRRHQEAGSIPFPAGQEVMRVVPTGPESMSVVPVGSFPLNERRPPPRKNKRKQQMQVMPSTPGQTGPYPWYPYMPCVPYPYPYPYYFGGCMWPSGAPAASTASWSGHDESERTSSRQDSIPATLDSQRLESRASHPSRDSISPVSQRSPSPTAASHLTDIHSIAPSDSVSVRGHKRESSLERALRGPTPPPRTKSRASSEFKSSDVGKTQEWILEMHRALGTTADGASDVTDKSSFTTAPSDVVVYKKIPPKRKRRKVKIDSLSDRDYLGDQKDLDNISDRHSVASDMTFDESSRLSSELTYAFRKLEKSVDVFKTKISVDSTPVHSSAPSPSIDIIHSSGELTPTEGIITEPPPSDISIALDKTSKKITESQDQHEASAKSSECALSPGSVWSLPSLESAKTEPTVDVSVPRVVIKSRDVEPSHFRLDPAPEPQQQPTVPQPTALSPTPETGPLPPTSDIPVLQTPAEQNITPATAAIGSQEVSIAVNSQSVTTSADVTTMTVPPADDTSPPAPPTEVTQPETTSETITSQAVLAPSPNQPVTISAPSASQPVPESSSASQPIELTETPSGASAGAGVTESTIVSEGGRDSRASSGTFFSLRPSDDPVMVDTDSTDILLPTTDATTADEGEEHTDSTTAVSPGPDEGYQWVLQQPGETPDLFTSPAGEDERRNAWRAEVSLWRARLVVSLCRGRGLDRQDWATFHLLVHHPLTLDLKLSLLHAPRLCAANTSTGAALVRVALIHLAQYGETLLQPEGSRQHGWRSIKVDPNQPWAPVKGAVEILRSLGYCEREDGGVLRYPRRSNTEVSVLARLTLDMLVLAEELRLYLTGTHQYPSNISELFFSSVSSAVPTELPQRPPSSAGSFVSAHSEASLDLRRASQASSVTDDDTETLQASVRQTKTLTKKTRRGSTSEEEVTLRDDIINNVMIKTEEPEVTPHTHEQPKEEAVLSLTSGTLPVNTETGHLGSTVSLPAPAGDRLSVSTINTNMSSLPDLQSISPSSISQKSPRYSGSATSGSNETVTPVATPAPVTPASTTPAPTTPAPTTPAPTTLIPTTTAPTTQKPATSPAPEATDNPEEHVYEEIDLIRAQVQALRASSVPVESPPPPLPPKKKISSGGEDDSGLSLTYPQVEWSSASMPGSLRGGSTGAKRKKRRAPMPPEFMPSDWKHYQNGSQGNIEQTIEIRESKEDGKKKAEYRKSLNPFYEDIDSIKEKVKELNENSDVKTEIQSVIKDSDGNPFVTDGTLVAGYVGRNPFYEDVELLKDKKECNEESEPSRSLPSPKLDGSVCAMGSLSELQDESFVVRPKRRAPKPPPTPQPNTHPSTPEPPTHPTPPNPTKPDPPKRPPTPKILKKVSSTSPASLPKSEYLPTEQDNLKQEVVADGGDQHKHGNISVQTPSTSISDKLTEINDTVTPITGEKDMFIDPKKNEVESHLDTEETNKRVPTDAGKIEKEINTESSKTSSPKQSDSCAIPVSKQDQQVSKTEEAKQVTPKVTRAAHQRVQHPKTPPPPPPKAESVREAKETTAETDGPPPPVPPPKAPLSLLDDIPYMDANEIKYAKAKQCAQSSQQHGKSEVATIPPLSPTIIRQSTLLLRGTRNVPFIDDSDLPPDCPPPPPPGPPPESPPETPHTSPPETPHTSPPDTPRASPQPQIMTGAPLASTSPSDMKSTQDVDTSKIESAEDDKDKAPPIPPKTSQLATTMSTTEPTQLISSVASSTTHSPTSTDVQPPISPETSQSPPSLPPKPSLQAVTPAPSETSVSDTHEQVSGKHSVQSSVSDERYEIPDTSIAPPPRPPPPKHTPTTTQVKDKTPEPYTAPSEADRYEVPEVPGEEVKTSKTTEVEERYEIPEVVKETSVAFGSNGGTSVSAKPSCTLL